jgi:hypothetical protein
MLATMTGAGVSSAGDDDSGSETAPQPREG